jgi:hypothetical protein
MHKLYKSLITVLITATICSCERDIDIAVDAGEDKLVVEATIVRGEAPIVVLSKSLNFFKTLDFATLSGSFVKNAVVKINNGSVTHQLQEYNVPLPGGLFYTFYSTNLSTPSTAFVGETNKTYRLDITTPDNKTYFSTTTIPDTTKRVLALRWQALQDPADSAWARVYVRVSDRAGLGDYAQYFTKRNSEPFYKGAPSAFDDKFIDGTTYEVSMDRGRAPGDTTDSGYRVFFKRGDTVTFNLSTIDKATFDFWRTFEFATQNIGNPFSSPSVVLSNIKGAPALGYFGGYNPQIRSIIIR